MLVQILRLLEAALSVSTYTDKIDSGNLKKCAPVPRESERARDSACECVCLRERERVQEREREHE